jgi:hypothetical protein
MTNICLMGGEVESDIPKPRIWGTRVREEGVDEKIESAASRNSG